MAMHGRGGGPFGPGRGPSQAKATQFGPTAKRLLGRLSTQKVGLSIVLAVTVISQVLGIFGPKVLGDATNEVFKGLIGGQLPAGVSKADLIAQLRARGQNQFADFLQGMDVIPGQGIDFTS